MLDVARASFEELLQDYLDFLRQNNLKIWSKDNLRAVEIRQLAYRTNRTYKTYATYMSNAESAANCLLCLINQASYLLDKQLESLNKDLLQTGDFKDRLKEVRKREIFGNNDDYDEFLKSIGKRRLENGRVVDLDSKEDK